MEGHIIKQMMEQMDGLKTELEEIKKSVVPKKLSLPIPTHDVPLNIVLIQVSTAALHIGSCYRGFL